MVVINLQRIIIKKINVFQQMIFGRKNQRKFFHWTNFDINLEFLWRIFSNFMY